MLLLNVEAKWKRTQSGDEPVHRAFLMLFNSARRYHTEERHMIYCDAEMNESIWRLDSHGPPWHDRIPAVIGRRTGPPGGGEDWDGGLDGFWVTSVRYRWGRSELHKWETEWWNSTEIQSSWVEGWLVHCQFWRWQNWEVEAPKRQADKLYYGYPWYQVAFPLKVNDLLIHVLSSQNFKVKVVQWLHSFLFNSFELYFTAAVVWRCSVFLGNDLLTNGGRTPF